MILNLNIAYLHLRLCKLFGGDEWFDSIDMLFAGDLLQLPPVCSGPDFDRVNNKMVLSKLGCMASVNTWKETVVYDELTINECQKDPEFCSLLDEVRRGCVSEESIDTLRGRVSTRPVVDQFRALEGSGQSPVCLIPNRRPCDEFNNAMLNSQQSEVIDTACTNKLTRRSGSQVDAKSSKRT